MKQCSTEFDFSFQRFKYWRIMCSWHTSSGYRFMYVSILFLGYEARNVYRQHFFGYSSKCWLVKCRLIARRSVRGQRKFNLLPKFLRMFAAHWSERTHMVASATSAFSLPKDAWDHNPSTECVKLLQKSYFEHPLESLTTKTSGWRRVNWGKRGRWQLAFLT